MSAATCSAALFEPEIHFIDDSPEAHLAGDMHELSNLRYAILLRAGWVAAGGLEEHYRNELLIDLQQLRWLYMDKVDVMAMTFGTALALKAKEEVERQVVVPEGIKPPVQPALLGEYSF